MTPPSQHIKNNQDNYTITYTNTSDVLDSVTRRSVCGIELSLIQFHEIFKWVEAFSLNTCD